MNNKDRFLAIHEFLKPYQRIWQNEIMVLYPDPFPDYDMRWIEEMASFKNKADIIELEKKNVTPFISNKSLLSYYKSIDELCTLPPLPQLPPVPEDFKTWLFMIPKKQHEIKRLAPLVHKFYQEKKIERIVDIGGGIGLLAQTLNNYYGMKVLTVDMDPILQNTGSTRHDKTAKDPLNKVQYLNLKVAPGQSEFSKVLAPKSMTLGLHTCGHLANDQLKASAENKLSMIINFGCCYHKLDSAPDGENISKIAQSLPDKFTMSQFALTLACRAHRKMDEKDYDLKLKVKLYRYTMHFLLYDHYEQKTLTSLGNSNPRLYDESFGTYALEQLGRINLKIKHTKEELDAYFTNLERQEMVWKMLSAGLIRNALGRLLELYILLDRVCYLEEHGYQVELLEFFDESISPRNLGIVAQLNS